MLKEFNRITVRAQLWWGKTLNGTSGKKSFLMRGAEVPYEYQSRLRVKVGDLEEFIEEHKEAIVDDIKKIQAKAAKKTASQIIQVNTLTIQTGVARMIKGIRGAIRHRIMHILRERKIDYCSPAQKKKFQSGEETLLEGEHLMGECEDEPCPVRQLFGMWREESPVRVWSDVMVETDKPDIKIKPQKGVSFCYVAMEERQMTRRDRKVIQDFAQQYLTGEFRFYIEYKKKLPKWLVGLLLEGILSVTNIGSGNTSGYGRVEIKETAFEKITWERKLGPEKDGKIAIIEEEKGTNINKQLEECLTAWRTHKHK